jgi:hypothetical protein
MATPIAPDDPRIELIAEGIHNTIVSILRGNPLADSPAPVRRAVLQNLVERLQGDIRLIDDLEAMAAEPETEEHHA